MVKTILAVLGMGALLLHTGSAHAQNYPWCAQRGEATNCGFVTYEQCMDASRWCYNNPMYRPPAAEPRSRRAPRGRHG